MQVSQLTILGVGLLGGSVGLAAKAKRAALHVRGVGRDERNLARARSSGAIDSYSTNVAEAVADADLVVICTPVDRIAADVLAVAQFAPARCLITDVGSTKGNILQALAGKLSPTGPTFVPAHPLAGSEKRGSANANAELFMDRLVITTPTADTDDEATAAIECFWRQLGARVLRMTPAEHDLALAFTSHLPHAAASALAGVTPTGWLNLTAGGYRDSTRIAAGDPDLWAAIFEANGPAVLGAVDQFLARMQEFRRIVAGGEHAALIHWLAEGKRVRDALGS
jgi:cyclohexadieny/prephenate dehydrogenase